MGYARQTRTRGCSNSSTSTGSSRSNLGLKERCRSGSITYYLSPLREESKPSFTVEYYTGEWRWRDWGGDEADRGDIIELVERVYNVDFPEALRMLLSREYPAEYYKRESEIEKRDRDAKIAYARRLYARLLKVNNIDAISAYFRERGVTYHFPMGCALHNDFREKKVYLATPVPTPWDLTALECRELKGDGKKTLGAGGLWFLEERPKTGAHHREHPRFPRRRDRARRQGDIPLRPQQRRLREPAWRVPKKT